MSKCDCGAQAVGSDKHSSWCSTERTEEIQLEEYPQDQEWKRKFQDLSVTDVSEWYRRHGYSELADMYERLYGKT